MTGDIPHIGSSVYASNTYAGNAMGGAAGWIGGAARPSGASGGGYDYLAQMERRQAPLQMFKNTATVETETMPEPKTRFVRVLIVDPDENIPLKDRLLYSGDEKLTDLTDQELFFELDIRDLLAKHNAKRVKIVNKTVKERTEYLEDAKIRDLRMVVTTIASF